MIKDVCVARQVRVAVVLGGINIASVGKGGKGGLGRVRSPERVRVCS